MQELFLTARKTNEQLNIQQNVWSFRFWCKLSINLNKSSHIRSAVIIQISCYTLRYRFSIRRYVIPYSNLFPSIHLCFFSAGYPNRRVRELFKVLRTRQRKITFSFSTKITFAYKMQVNACTMELQDTYKHSKFSIRTKQITIYSLGIIKNCPGNKNRDIFCWDT